MHKYIVFRADKNEPGWEDRKLQHTQGLTRILTEHFDSSDRPTPEPGYRPKEFVRVEEFVDPAFPESSTHSRVGDWVVTRVEEYTPETPMGEFDMVVICYCKYIPIDSPLKPMSKIKVTLDSFGGDEKAYQGWMDSQTAIA